MALELDPLFKHLRQNPPPILFHYTSMSVLDKITASGKIWASEVQFLNDSSEYHHARRYIEMMLRGRIGEDAVLRARVEEDLRVADAQVEQNDVFVASLSKDGDSLPQWRGYCSSGQGVAIGFNPYAVRDGGLEFNEQVKGTPDDEPATEKKLLQCVYTDKQKEKLIGESIDNYLGIIQGKHRNVLESRAGRYLRNTIELCSPLLKDANFKEEKEWRLVVNCYYEELPKRHFRTWGSTVVPFITLDVKTNYRLDFIREVVIGPCPNEDLAVLGVTKLLKSRDLRRATVRKSSIPFRTW